MRANFPPGPKYWNPLIVPLRFKRAPIDLLTELARDFGDLAHVRIGNMHLVALNHPDYIEQVLVTNSSSFRKSPTLRRAKRLLGEGLLTSEDPLHKRQQRLMTGSFTGHRIRTYSEVVSDYTGRITEKWQNGLTLDFSDCMMQLTLSIIGKVLFGSDFESNGPSIERDFRIALDRLRPFRAPFLTTPQFLEWLPGSKGWQFRKARERLDSVVLRLISSRRERPSNSPDLLSVLLASKDDESSEGAGMADFQARDEVITLMLAGHETVAHALAWTCYLLSEHPEVEAKFHKEVDELFLSETAAFDQHAKLSYTRMIISEAMRLFPPVWVIARETISDYTLGNYLLPKGTVVSMCQFVLHRDKRWFEDPLKFKPERWSSDRCDEIPKFAYFPFGSGSRHCLGERFAWMEAILIIATLGRKWRLRLAPEAKIAMDPGFTLRPKFGVKVVVSKRF
jgi:cytochrome P450